MNELQIFENNEFGKITVVEKNSEPWFMAKEIAEILDYNQTSNMLKLLDSDEKANLPIWSVSSRQNRIQTIISESGFYSAILRSNKPESKKFRKWVTSDVLPTIRKTGSYSLGQPQEPQNFITAKAHLDLELFAQAQLKTSEASRLIVTHSVYEDYGISTKRLPIYTPNVRVTFSAKDLLNKNSCEISPMKFNQAMIRNGYMEEKERSSSKGKNGVKKFKALTETGLRYGQNDASKHNPRETQAHYFEDTFMELFSGIYEFAGV